MTASGPSHQAFLCGLGARGDCGCCQKSSFPDPTAYTFPNELSPQPNFQKLKVNLMFLNACSTYVLSSSWNKIVFTLWSYVTVLPTSVCWLPSSINHLTMKPRVSTFPNPYYSSTYRCKSVWSARRVEGLQLNFICVPESSNNMFRSLI